MDKIIIRGAKEHNLKNISLEIPRNKLTVITGLSGSGKSSLAFDTIYAEGQRRYVESLSSYARQFLGMMEKPDVDSIDGLSPAISIEQKTTSKNPRSTVGTVTEIYDYLRLLFARAGTPFCPSCGIEISAQSVDQIIDEVMLLPENTKLQILSPIVQNRKGEFQKLFEKLTRKGFVRIIVDDISYNLEEKEEIKLEKNKKHSIDVVIDRIILKSDNRSRLAEAIEIGIEESEGLIKILYEGEEKIFSTLYSCPSCGFSLPEIHPRIFSFNSPQGACPACHGLGETLKAAPELILNYEKSINNDGINFIMDVESSKWYHAIMKGLSEKYKFSLSKPIGELSDEVVQILLYGTGEDEIEIAVEGKNSSFKSKKPFEGLVPMVERRFQQTESENAKEYYEQFMISEKCSLCKGARLKKEVLSIKIDNHSIVDLTEKNIKNLLEFFLNINLAEIKKQIAGKILKEIESRLSFLKEVGVDYLNLARKSETLSGGEMQRIRLATQIGTKLTGVLYVLDEPTIGLHQRDNDRLIQTLITLRDLGNTLIVVEHDEQTIRTADYIVDMGPGAGINGGKITAEGTIEEILKSEESLTAAYLNHKKTIPLPESYREGNGKKIVLKKAATNNLKNMDVEFPLGKMIAVTGVSGSGKSSLVLETLLPAVQQRLFRNYRIPENTKFESVSGTQEIDKMIDIDQSPIGRTPRSNPATYTKLFDPIREIFAMTPEAKERGYKSGRFSFNVRGGRCETCRGDGVLKIEMHFLPDVYITCEVCKGKRYNKETLEVFYRGKNIYDVLDMSVDEAAVFFENHLSIYNKLKTLQEVGLGYIKLGQKATTLSGGEAQRIKLSRELSKRSTGKTLYILDEPTTGLHFADVHKLIEVLNQLTDKGNTMIIIEHNLDVIKSADHIIDIGPEGGDGGGTVIAQGTPKEIVKNKKSYTGYYLKDAMKNI
ncbi:MAG TPA: excinuclease ABC subunit UvrA [Spirochaetia bacterium]|nr:excinuclease ABC subunit UvrA [Spirochaetia bacterium]